MKHGGALCCRKIFRESLELVPEHGVRTRKPIDREVAHLQTEQARFRYVNHLPVIALTAYPETLSVEKAYQAGCDGYLQKPVDLTDLDAALRRFLRTA